VQVLYGKVLINGAFILVNLTAGAKHLSGGTDKNQLFVSLRLADIPPESRSEFLVNSNAEGPYISSCCRLYCRLSCAGHSDTFVH
jgi:hypothetical protein